MDYPVYILNRCSNITDDINKISNLNDEYFNDEITKEDAVSQLDRLKNIALINVNEISRIYNNEHIYKLKKSIENLCSNIEASFEDGNKLIINEEITQIYELVNFIFQQANDETNSSIIDATAMSIIVAVFNVFISTSLLVSLIIFQKKLVNKNISLVQRTNIFNMLSSSLNFVCTVKKTGSNNIEYASDNIEQILGFNHDIYVNDASFYSSYFIDDSLKKINEENLQLNYGNTFKTDIKIKNPITNEIRTFEYKSCKLKDVDNVDTIISSVTDVTDLRIQNEKLTNALNSAKEANIAKRNFLSNMSHEIRTPMNAIFGITTLAKRNLNNEELLLDYLNKIEDSSNYLLKLINDVLDMAKIESQKITINKDKFNFKDLLDQLTNIFITNCNENNQKFNIIYRGVLSQYLIGDYLRISQILINLLSNASKFTPNGGSISLRVSEEKINESLSNIYFVVTDSGIGISEDFVKNIFMPFEQEKRIDGNINGTGLGLAIAYNLITAMGGTISVSSKKDKGSTFFVTLPLETINEPVITNNNLNVLIISDDINRNHIIKTIDILNINSDYINYKKYSEINKNYDYVLVDIDVSHSLIDVAREIKKANNCKVILLSSFNEQSVSNTVNMINADGYIMKPLFPSSIRRVLVESKIDSSPKKEEDYDFTGKRVLYADDNELNLQIGANILELSNISVDTASNGYIAFSKFIEQGENYYDIILLDIHMPIMDGIECTKNIRNSNHPNALNIPIIAMTADTFSDDVSRFLEAGMNDHIGKPINYKKLFEILNKYIKK